VRDLQRNKAAEVSSPQNPSLMDCLRPVIP